jgi:hypothetical protein
MLYASARLAKLVELNCFGVKAGKAESIFWVIEKFFQNYF